MAVLSWGGWTLGARSEILGPSGDRRGGPSPELCGREACGLSP